MEPEAKQQRHGADAISPRPGGSPRVRLGAQDRRLEPGMRWRGTLPRGGFPPGGESPGILGLTLTLTLTLTFTLTF